MPVLIVSASISPVVWAGADCDNGNFGGIYQDEDVQLSGDLFVTSNVTIRNNVTVTLEAGTSVTFCDEYQIDVNSGGNFRAVGTDIDPIVFAADDPAIKWRRIVFSGEADDSILRHVVLNNGGGNDPTATAGAIEFNSTLAPNPLPSPTLDFVTVNDSGAYGLYLRVDSDDAAPPSITNLAVNNSERAAILANAQVLGGLGSGNSYAGNAPDAIQVISGGASRLHKSQIWRDQGVPYEFLGTAIVAAPSAGDPFPRLTIREGATLLMHPDARLEIGTSLGRGASLAVDGTAASPVVFTRLDTLSGPWDKLELTLYPGAEADIQHAEFSFGGSGGSAMIEQIREGSLNLDHVQVANSMTAGLHARGSVNVRNSIFEFNMTGLEFWQTANAVVRNSEIRNNFGMGINSLDSGFNDNCVDAIGNYWGSFDGPPDSQGMADACGDGRTNAGGGDAVSGGVLYQPWLTGAGPLVDRSIIQPNSFYVIADGVDNTQITITLRDAYGNPVSGKDVELNATVGDVIQPLQPTDADGVTTAEISATSAGFAYLSAHNLTDDEPLAGVGGVTFWQGSGDAGGLIDPGGTPYASPQLEITGAPYQVGFPVGMRIPMQNSNPFAVEVDVVYGVSNLGIGGEFTPVFMDSMTLQPGEIWDAEGAWLPTSDGHRCFQATISSSASATMNLIRGDGETTPKQVNTNQDPCNPDNLNPNNLIPRGPGGIATVGRHFRRSYNEVKKTNECIESELGGGGGGMQPEGGVRDYEEVVTPPVFDPPPIPVEGELTPEQVVVLNELAQTAADLLSLNLAIGATAQRLNWAAQAAMGLGSTGTQSPHPQSPLGTGGFHYVDLQYQAYRDFINQYADKLDLYASQIGDLLAVLDTPADTYFLPEDFVQTRNDLASGGFDDFEQMFYEQSGLDTALIDQLALDLVEAYDNHPSDANYLSDILASIQAESTALAARLRMQYPAHTQALHGGEGPAAVFVPVQTFDFEVSQPFTQEETVDLVVRPVSLPLGWTHALSEQSVTIPPGETAELNLKLYPSGDLLEGDLVQVAVEGYVNGELIGGILMEYLAPSLAPAPDNFFSDGFE